MIEPKKPKQPDLLPQIVWILRYMHEHGMSVRFDYRISVEGQMEQAKDPKDFREVLKFDPMTHARLQDQLLLASRPMDFKPHEIKAALRIVIQRLSKKRYSRVWLKILNAVGTHDRETAEREWERLNSLFVTTTGLPAIVLKSFVWSCMQKAIGRPVTWHLMPIIYGAQGTGKTVFARNFPSPLEELVADNVLFTELADRRSADIFRYAVLTCDDLEKMPSTAIPMIKSVLTAKSLRRRRLMTSMSDAIRQQCMPIGTSNVPVEQLVADDTGNRRFVTLEFRNGDPVKGGSEDVWETVNSLDYMLLWQSVDPFSPNPILPYLEELAAHQALYMGTPALLAWLKGVDLDSEAFRCIRARGGYSSDKLRTKFMSDTGEDISQKRFSDEMVRYFGRDESPFCDKGRGVDGVVYVAKPPAKLPEPA